MIKSVDSSGAEKGESRKKFSAKRPDDSADSKSGNMAMSSFFRCSRISDAKMLRGVNPAEDNIVSRIATLILLVAL